jgi:diguanylate cyclase (GGDEF)-like protein
VQAFDIVHVQHERPHLLDALIGVGIFVFCLIGIQSRVLFELASIWPANAAFLSVLIVFRLKGSMAVWLYAAFAYVAADLLTGATLDKSVLLNLANLGGVAVGAIAASTLRDDVILFQRPIDTLLLTLTMMAASAATATFGAIASAIVSDLQAPDAFALWFSSELVNYASFTPFFILLLRHIFENKKTEHAEMPYSGMQLAAVASLALSLVVTHVLGGPGASAICLPALLWCAVCMPPVFASGLTSMTVVWLLIAGPLQLIPWGFSLHSPLDLSSFRFGLAMVALGPFAVIGVNIAWLSIKQTLKFAATHDSLTGLMNRSAFLETAKLGVSRRNESTYSLMIIDIDHFTSINTSHANQMRDKVLCGVAQLLIRKIRRGDIVCRLGGQQFAVAMPGTPLDEATVGAERLRNEVSRLEIMAPYGVPVPLNVSIGITSRTNDVFDIEQLLGTADAALLEAKSGSRNAVVDRRAIS